MKRDTKILIVSVIVLALELVFCFNAFSNKNNANNGLNKAKVALRKTNKQATVMKTDKVHVKAATLAPKKQQKTTKRDIKTINKVIDNTFAYNSPNDYLKQSVTVRQLADGPFYKWWWGKSVKNSAQTMQFQAKGRKYKRYYQNYELTRTNAKTYYVYLRSAVLIGDAHESDMTPDTFFLKFVKRGAKWQVTRIKNVEVDSRSLN